MKVAVTVGFEKSQVARRPIGRLLEYFRGYEHSGSEEEGADVKAFGGLIYQGALESSLNAEVCRGV